jgi:hypothetical protein
VDRVVQVALWVGLAALLWVGGKFAQPAIDRWQVQKLADLVAVRAVHPAHFGHIEDTVEGKLLELDLPLTPEDVQVQVDERGIRAEVRIAYWRETDFLKAPFFGEPVIDYDEDGVAIWRDSDRGTLPDGSRAGLRMQWVEIIVVNDRSQAD